MTRKRDADTGETYYQGTTEIESSQLGERYIPSKKLSERTYSWQFPRDHFDLFTKFAGSYWSSQGTVEDRGFAHVVDDRTFLLVPELGKLDMKIICKVSPGQKLPADHSYVVVKGQRTALFDKKYLAATNRQRKNLLAMNSYPALNVESFYIENFPEFLVSLDTSFSDFHGTLFDNWSDLPRYVKEAVALSLVSSPPEILRLGGLTTDLFLDRELKGDLNRANELMRDVSRSIDPELYEPWKIEMPTGKISLNPFKWQQSSLSADDPKDQLLASLLERGNRNTVQLRELTLNLGSKLTAPPSVDDMAASKADIPLILLSDARRARGVSRDPRITNFIIAVHTNNVIGPASVRERWLPRITEKLAEIKQTYSGVTEFAKLVNPDINGTTRSVFQVAYAFARSYSSLTLNDTALEEGMQVVSESLKTALDKWEDVKNTDPRNRELMLSLTAEGRRIYYWVRDHPNSTYQEIRENVFPNFKESLFESLFNDTFERRAIYESLPGKYSAA